MAEDVASKKRKVDEVEAAESGEQARPSAPAPPATDDLSVTETPDAEIAQLRQAYQKAQDTIKEMEASRRTVAARLLELGQRGVPEAIADPWSRERLEEEIAEREDDFYQDVDEIGADEDATHQERFDATYIQRLKDALEGACPCDATGYLSKEGKWIEWIPTDEELKDFHWEDVGFCPPDFSGGRSDGE